MIFFWPEREGSRRQRPGRKSPPETMALFVRRVRAALSASRRPAEVQHSVRVKTAKLTPAVKIIKTKIKKLAFVEGLFLLSGRKKIKKANYTIKIHWTK